jgi:Plasmid pRiA4b ORF-3-like protein
VPEQGTNAGLAAAITATEPARWLLATGIEGVALTQTHSLARAVVREAALRWPGWWNAELFGEPHREADVRIVGTLREGLQRLGLMRRRNRTLRTSPRGRELAEDPLALLLVLAADLGGGDPFEEDAAEAVAGLLTARGQASHDHLARAALTRVARAGWAGPDGLPPDERELSAIVSDVLCRGEAYGLIRREIEPGGSRVVPTRISLTDGGTFVFRRDRPGFEEMPVLVFDAELVGVRSVRASVAVGAEQHLTALHDIIQEAFGWFDDHLYSFWLNNEFYGGEEFEYTSPDIPDEGCRTADVPIAELDLPIGAKIAYVFDFGDDWRVRFTLREQTDPDVGDYPRVLQVKGTPPPQYDDPGEVDA